MRLCLASFAALWIVLAGGCDSAAPVEVDVLGTWSATTILDREYATSTVGQTILDPSRPGDGALTVSGDDAETLRYVSRSVAFGDTTWTVSSVSLWGGTGVRPEVYGFAMITRYGVVLTLARGGDFRQYGAETAPTRPFRWDGRRFSLPAPRTLAHLDGGTVMMAGSVVPATQTLAAGRDVLVRTHATSWTPDNWPTTFTFRADGTFRRTVTQVETGDVYAYDGTWERLAESPLGGERLRLTLLAAGTTTETRMEARAERVGADLHLTFDEHPCAASNAGCLDGRAREYGMAPGTLSDLRASRTLVFTPASPG